MMSTVRMVAIPEADADLLLKGLRNQASGGYSAPWIELCDRMVRLLEGTVVWQGAPLTHAEDMGQATAQLDKMGRPKVNPILRQDALVDALKRARTKVNQEWTQAHEQSRIALSGAAYALDYLARELTPERDGAGALPVQPPEPVAATSTPAPSRLCAESPDGLHNRVQMLDGYNQPMGDVHCGYCGAPR